MKRALAALAAVALVAVAWWVRTSFIEDRSDSGDDGGDELVLRCGSDLADVCERLAAEDSSVTVTVTADGDTADALARKGAVADFDAWLAAGPWPAIVADDRRVAGLDRGPLGETIGPLAGSRVTFVGPADRLDALARHCGGTVTWSCVGDVSGRPWDAIGGSPAWGEFRTGLSSTDTGGGLVAFDQAVADRSGVADWSTTELEDVSGWLSQLVGATTFTDDPLEVMLTRPGSFSLTAPLERRSAPAMGRGDVGDRHTLLYPEPMVTAEVTLSAAAGRDVEELIDRIGRDRLVRALRDDGWSDAGGRGSGLTSPGALQALRTTVEEMRP